MKSAVITFPGSNCDRDMAEALALVTGKAPVRVWHKDTNFEDVDLIALPGGFSYGDYLRCGAMSARSPVMAEVIKRAGKGVHVLGVCNGFQILTEAGLLPGALMRNRGLDFICEDTTLQVANTDTAFTRKATLSEVRIPVAHHDGNYFIDDEGYKALEGEGQVAFRYASDINGSIGRVAGITNKAGNVLGMMPHPERAVDPDLGLNDGRFLFESLMETLGA